MYRGESLRRRGSRIRHRGSIERATAEAAASAAYARYPSSPSKGRHPRRVLHGHDPYESRMVPGEHSWVEHLDENDGLVSPERRGCSTQHCEPEGLDVDLEQVDSVEPEPVHLDVAAVCRSHMSWYGSP